MGNPRAVPDERGEWIELRNLEARNIDLRGWTIASANDRGTTIGRSVVLGPNGFIVLARDPDPANRGAYVYGAGVALGNGADWIAIRLPDGRTVDSIAWTSAIPGASRALRDAAAPRADVAGAAWVTSSRAFGRGDFGSPGQPNDGAAAATPGRTAPTTPAPTTSSERLTSRTGPPALGPGSRDSTLAIRILDVGQG